MAGKTLVGGTAYDITKGKTLIGGTAYDITAGKTLVGGTGYDIKFGSEPTLRDVLLDMTVVKDQSTNYQYENNISLRYNSNYSNLTDSYILALTNGYMSITAFNTGTATTIKQMSNSQARICKTNGIYINLSTDGTNYTSVYGGSLLQVNFPSYSMDVVNQILSDATFTRIAGRNSSSTGYVRTKNVAHSFYITNRYKTNGSSYTGTGADNTTGLVIWERDGATWTELKQVTPNWHAGAVSGGYLTLGAGTYGASLIAIDE